MYVHLKINTLACEVVQDELFLIGERTRSKNYRIIRYKTDLLSTRTRLDSRERMRQKERRSMLSIIMLCALLPPVLYVLQPDRTTREVISKWLEVVTVKMHDALDTAPFEG